MYTGPPTPSSSRLQMILHDSEGWAETIVGNINLVVHLCQIQVLLKDDTG